MTKLVPDDFIEALCAAAAAETLPRFRRSGVVDNKDNGGFDPVTEADRAAERAMRQLISIYFPDDAVLGEEYGETPGTSGRRWVLDPVDGTRSFICGVPFWTTLIGLEDGGVPQFGIIDQPFLKERWVGDRLGGTLSVNGRFPPSPTTKTDLADARLMITDIRAGEYLTEKEAAACARLAQQAQLLRQGLDSYAFGLVASGQLDLVVEAGLSWYDIAAPAAVITAAGGVVTDWEGRPLTAKEGRIRTIAARTPDLAAQALDVLRS